MRNTRNKNHQESKEGTRGERHVKGEESEERRVKIMEEERVELLVLKCQGCSVHKYEQIESIACPKLSTV